MVPFGAPDYRQIQLVFAAVGAVDDCFAGAEAPEPVPIEIAGLDGLYVEPFENPSVEFSWLRFSATTGAYALPVGDQTLCVYLGWDADSTAEELEAARQVLESIRAHRYGIGIQFILTLPAGWSG